METSREAASEPAGKYTDKLRLWIGGLLPFEAIDSYSREVSGMLGDLGLYIPIVVQLALKGQLDLGSTLITTGLCNIITGLLFKTPMCVQPMKAIATAAIAYKLTESQIMAAGLITSFVICGLGVTNLIEVVHLLIPYAAVRGLQLGLGMNLFQKSLQMLPDSLVAPEWNATNSWLRYDGYLFAALALVFCLVSNKSKRIPTAFVLFIIGIVVASVRFTQRKPELQLSGATTKMHVVNISPNDWAIGAVYGAIPQVPTTLLNSVVAVVRLNRDLYPTSFKSTGVSLRSVAVSVGCMNILFCWFGGYPMCHGSGGLAAQHRFGARTNLSVIFLGVCKLLIGIFFGAGLLQVLNYFPQGILAVLLAVASVELSASGRSGLFGSVEDARVCLLTAFLVCFWDQGTGILIGIIASYVLTVSDLFMGSAEDKARCREKFKVDLGVFVAAVSRAANCQPAEIDDSPGVHAAVPDADAGGLPNAKQGYRLVGTDKTETNEASSPPPPLPPSTELASLPQTMSPAV